MLQKKCPPVTKSNLKGKGTDTGRTKRNTKQQVKKLVAFGVLFVKLLAAHEFNGPQ